MKKLGIITVVTNEKQNLKDYFNSLAAQKFKDFKLYFVDNNSNDRSQEFFRELNREDLLDVRFVTLDHNSGFSGGSNIGAEKAIADGCSFLFFSNNDLVFDSDALDELLKLAESDPGVACAGPVLFYHSISNPGTIQEFGGKVNFKRGTLKKYFENTDLDTVTLPEVIETDFIGGGVCMVKADIFKKAGMYETSYFGYFDEIDLSRRLKETGGYKMLVTSKAKIWHNHNWEGKKNKNSFYLEYYLSERNKFLYYRKYRLYGSLALMLLEDLIKFPRRLWWFKKKCNFKLGGYYLKGMFDGLLNRKGKPKLSFVK